MWKNVDKTVLVTGASRGIGRAIALEFARNSYNVIVCARNEADLDTLKKEITDMGASCISYKCDVSDYSQVEAMFEAISRDSGAIDILINNAGMSIVGLFQDVTRDSWDNIVNTNLGSVYNCCHFAVPNMISNKCGKIINISSVWGNVGASCEVAYSATKGAINSFTKALAKELAPSNIQVNAIACGAIDTQMNSFLSDEDRLALCEEIPSGRMGQPSEVAELILGIINSEYLTGQIITMDGGWI